MDELRFAVGDGEVSGLLDWPVGEVHGSYVLAHGAGAGMRHHFLADVAGRLSARGIAVLRYQFPYMETRQRRPAWLATKQLQRFSQASSCVRTTPSA